MTFHAYVERPKGGTTDILLEEARRNGTSGVLEVSLDTFVFGALGS